MQDSAPQPIDPRLPWEHEDWVDESDDTEDDFDAAWERGAPVEVEVSPALAPICSFDRAKNAAERGRWAEEVAKFLNSPLGADVPAGSPVIPLLMSDLMGDWFAEIEDADGAVLAIQYIEGVFPNPDEVEPISEVGLVVVQLRRSDRDVNEVVDRNELSWCHLSASQPANLTTDSTAYQCEFFWWAHHPELIGWEVTTLWPLGNQEGDAEDNNRVGREAAGMDPEAVVKAVSDYRPGEAWTA